MEISVVIPTYNRALILERTLTALSGQADSSFEVIVVDDGSNDGTADLVARLQPGFPVPLDYFHQPNRKQGAARNLGAHHARGDRLVFLGDDIVPCADFLGQHKKALGGVPAGASPDRLVSVGYTTWPVQYRTSRFMEYVGEQGWQFGYSLITDPQDLPFNFFYTSNLMISRAFFLEAGGFDEDFREYGWEDIELSYRLKKVGMRLIYAPKARAEHFHHLNLVRFIERQRQVGRSAWELYRKHPELGAFLGIEGGPQYGPIDELRLRLATLLCRITENLRRPDLSRFYPDLLTYHYLIGLREAAPVGNRNRGESGNG